jgi:hypothetical protein
MSDYGRSNLNSNFGFGVWPSTVTLRQAPPPRPRLATAFPNDLCFFSGRLSRNIVSLFALFRHRQQQPATRSEGQNGLQGGLAGQ